MYIENVIIEGYKSYREQTTMEPFDSGHNVIVGRNGSGKSNFFSAIQFVLSDEFHHLTSEQRQTLLHEGTGPKVINASVEIVFNNDDGRIPLEDKKVCVRRDIGSKRDQYFCNRKKMTRFEVLNLFESAGFSLSNPYYIIKQGKISQLAIASDVQRLKLLKEVAGVSVYEDETEKCRVELQESRHKRDKVVEILRQTEVRLKRMEEECKDLEKFQKLDKERRGLEYAVYVRELKETRKILEKMEIKYKRVVDEKGQFSDMMIAAQKSIGAVSEDMREVKSKLSQVEEEKNTYWIEQQALLKEKTKLELKIKYLEDEVLGDSSSKSKTEEELEKLQATITQTEAQLEVIKPQYEDVKADMDKLQQGLSCKSQRRQELYAKQGRGGQFTTKEERDEWINKEIRSVEQVMSERRALIEQVEKMMNENEKRRKEIEKKLRDLRSESTKCRELMVKYIGDTRTLVHSEEGKQAERDEYQRKENKLEQKVRSLKEDLAQVNQTLYSRCSKAILNGCDSVQKIVTDFRERGGYLGNIADQFCGLLIDKIQCEQSLYTAVEVASSNRLFNHIVISEKAATLILKEMNKQNLPGYVTFLPLDKLKIKSVKYPESEDVIPMIEKLQYSEDVQKAVGFVFGKVILCRHLESATKFAREVCLECVTLNGDKVSGKGKLTGGYMDPSELCLDVWKRRSLLRDQVAETGTELKTLQDTFISTQQEVNRIVSEIQKLGVKDSKTKNLFEKLEDDIRLLKREQAGLEHNFQSQESHLKQLKTDLDSLMGTKRGLEAELHQELMANLSVQEQQEVDQLSEEIRKQTQRCKDVSKSRIKLEEEKTKLEIMLKNNLHLKRDELFQALQKISTEDHKYQFEQAQKNIERVNSKIDVIADQYKEVEREVFEHQGLEKSLKSAMEEHEGKLKEIKKTITAKDKELNNMTYRKMVLHQKVDECSEKIRKLGPLPFFATDMHEKLHTRELLQKLADINMELEKYPHANKMVLEQFSRASERMKKHNERLKQLDEGYEKILEVRNSLKQRRCDAVQFTFNEVSQYFTQVFKELSPQGSAELIMIEDESEPREQGTVENLIGVGIRVSFTGRQADIKGMNQLSGGQKTLVSLALIFAIQKCNPVPFYIFDEIDQALDAQHRGAVAEMIHKLSKDAQFIMSTFRPEMLKYADKYYGVRYKNKVSHLECVEKKEAYDFVEDDQARR